MAFDLLVIETGNGGDLVNLGNDLAVTESVSTMVYLALFGGNLKSSTTVSYVDTEDFSWWGNRLLMGSEPSQQFNSLTENVLNTTVLNSEGRQIIENAVIEDLRFLSKYLDIKVEVTLPSIDRVVIDITLNQKDTAQEARLIINFKKSTGGDFSIEDFSVSDFYI